MGPLGKYVKNLNKDSLKVSIWSGDVCVRDLELKRNALDSFRLPVVVSRGYFGCLKLKIPWDAAPSPPPSHSIFLVPGTALLQLRAVDAVLLMVSSSLLLGGAGGTGGACMVAGVATAICRSVCSRVCVYPARRGVFLPPNCLSIISVGSVNRRTEHRPQTRTCIASRRHHLPTHTQTPPALAL